MTISRMVSLAWRNLVHDRRRLAVSLAGVAFAVVLMAMELGFRFALLDSMVEVIRLLDTDLVVVSQHKNTLASSAPFNRRILQDILMCREVEEACPLYIETRFSNLRDPQAQPTTSSSRASRVSSRRPLARKIRVLAFNPRDHVFLMPEVDEAIPELASPETALYDSKSNEAIGTVQPGNTLTLAQRPVRIVGTFRLGADLVNDGNMIMTDHNFLRYFPDWRQRAPELRSVELGLIRLTPSSNPEIVRGWLDKRFQPRGVRVLTRDEFQEREHEFWNARTPIGFIFQVGAVLGLVVGGVICYQILSSDIADHISEYATLKAMGYANVYLVAVVMAEALFLAFLGFVPGLLVSLALYQVVAIETGLLMHPTMPRVLAILGLTVLMCLGSGLFAMRKLLSADPAGLF